MSLSNGILFVIRLSQATNSCSMCEKNFRSRMHLQRHIRDVHGPEIRPHLCDTCGKAFKRTDALQQHKLVHISKSARSLPYKCSICDKGFRSQVSRTNVQQNYNLEKGMGCGAKINFSELKSLLFSSLGRMGAFPLMSLWLLLKNYYYNNCYYYFLQFYHGGGILLRSHKVNNQ